MPRVAWRDPPGTERKQVPDVRGSGGAENVTHAPPRRIVRGVAARAGVRDLPYSLRKARMGSTASARRAGSHVPSSATVSNAATAPPSANGSSAPTP